MILLYWGLITICAILAFVLISSITHGKGRGIPDSWDHLLPVNSSYLHLLTHLSHPDALNRGHKLYGPTYHMKLGAQDWIVTTDWPPVKHVFEHRENFPAPALFREAVSFEMGPSMFTSEGEVWKKKHHLLQPMLRQKMLERHVTVVYEKATRLIDKFKDLVGSKGTSLEVLYFLKQMTIDVIGEVAFGRDFDALEEKPLTKDITLSQFLDMVIVTVNSRSYIPKFLWQHIPSGKRFATVSGEVKRLFMGILEESRNRARSEGDEPTTLISLLLSIQETEQDVSDDERIYPERAILGECFSLFVAGADSTANTFSMMLAQLAAYPEVQEKVRKEIEAVVQRRGRKESGEPDLPSYNDINSLHYLAAVITETQRLYPVANFFPREVLEDEEFNGIPLRKGCWVVINALGIHTSADYNRNPEIFNPERWLKGEGNQAKAGDIPFLGFGLGRRSCFGRHLAIMEMKVATFLLLQHFRLKLGVPGHSVEVENVFGLRPKNNSVLLNLEPLDT